MFGDYSQVEEIDLHLGLFRGVVVIAGVGFVAELLDVHVEVELVPKDQTREPILRLQKLFGLESWKVKSEQ